VPYPNKAGRPPTQESLPSQPLKNAKHEAFVQLLVTTACTDEDAWLGAGYQKGTGNRQTAQRVKNHKHVKARLQHLTAIRTALHVEAIKEAVASVGVDKKWVMEKLVRAVDMGLAATPVTDREGNPIGEYKHNIQGATSALKLIGQELGMFVERKEVTHIDALLDGLTHEDLHELRDAIRQQQGFAGVGQVAAGSSRRTAH
jgi:hypothetical protein